MKQTRGEYLVGVNFNPSASSEVDLIKAKAAELIDLIDDIVLPSYQPTRDEVIRLREMAIAGVENSAMLGVKAATKPARR